MKELTQPTERFISSVPLSPEPDSQKPKRARKPKRPAGRIRQALTRFKASVGQRIDKAQKTLGWINLWYVMAGLGWGIATLGQHLDVAELKLIGLLTIITFLIVDAVSRHKARKEREAHEQQ